MEKFAVDLDKVLDEFEFNEDRAERLANTPGRKSSAVRTPHIIDPKIIPPARHYRRPAFEPIDLADADFAPAPSTLDSHGSISESQKDFTNVTNDDLNNVSNEVSKLWQSGRNTIISENSHNILNGSLINYNDYATVEVSETGHKSGSSTLEDFSSANSILNNSPEDQETLEYHDCLVSPEVDSTDTTHISSTLLCDIASSESSVGENISVLNSDTSEKLTLMDSDSILREDSNISNDLIDSSRSDQRVDGIKDSLHDLSVLSSVPIKLETEYVHNEINCIGDVQFSDTAPNSFVSETESHSLISETESHSLISETIPIGFNEMNDISDADLQQYLEELEAEVGEKQPPIPAAQIGVNCVQSRDSYSEGTIDSENVKLPNKSVEESSTNLNEHCQTECKYSTTVSHKESETSINVSCNVNELSLELSEKPTGETNISIDHGHVVKQDDLQTVHDRHDINMNNTLNTENNKNSEKHHSQSSHHMVKNFNTHVNNSKDEFIEETENPIYPDEGATCIDKTAEIICDAAVSNKNFNSEITHTSNSSNIENPENSAHFRSHLSSDFGHSVENSNDAIVANNASHSVINHSKIKDSMAVITTKNFVEAREDAKDKSLPNNTSYSVGGSSKIHTSEDTSVTNKLDDDSENLILNNGSNNVENISLNNDSASMAENKNTRTVINNTYGSDGTIENTNSIITNLVCDPSIISDNRKNVNGSNEPSQNLSAESSQFVEDTKHSSVTNNSNHLINNSVNVPENSESPTSMENINHMTSMTDKVGIVNNWTVRNEGVDNAAGTNNQTNNINNLIIDYGKIDKNSKHLSFINNSLHSGELVDNINDQTSINCTNYSSSNDNIQGLENNHCEPSHNLSISGDDGNNNGASTSISVTAESMLGCREPSEIKSCLVRTPKDGNVINVMGEEEKPSRPKFLALSTQTSETDHSQNAGPSFGAPGETPYASHNPDPEDNTLPSSPDISESSLEQAVSPVNTPTTPDNLTPEDRNLGKVQPFWVPDSDAPNCMLCDFKFTLVKRRHHCRACGKVLCSKCCNLKSRLEYMDNAEARVCQPCFTVLTTVGSIEQGQSASGSPSIRPVECSPIRRPNPNNPMEYCSTIPPLEQAANIINQPPPTVLVPVGVLKREGSTKSKNDVAKQVMFSDGIRPGGDLTELDGSCEPRPPYRRPGRVQKRVGTPPGSAPVTTQSTVPKSLPPYDPKTMSYVPADKGLPPLAMLTLGEPSFDVPAMDNAQIMAQLDADNGLPLLFAINKNCFVHVKKLNLDCCVNRTCWSFTSVGLCTVGQDEVVLLLECLPDEKEIPRDVFLYYNGLYQDAARGNTFTEFGYTPIAQSGMFLGSADHGGFIYVRPTFQCLQKLLLPHAAYLVAILIHRWETSWARVFPIRLMLRLGAEFRYYPCMLVSVRHRSPVYFEIGHTIMNLLNDFRNLSYTLPAVRGLVIHMEDRQTSVLIPKNRYDQVTRALNNSNDPVLAFAGNFSPIADSHLVCIQVEEDETYRTQAINIHNKPRKVTGASFVVFNGALKSTANLTAKSSIVEDGLMVQISPETMQALRTALRNMKDYTIGCGPVGAAAPDETVLIKWVGDDRHYNIGVKSEIDGRPFDGIASIRVHNGTDYVGGSRFIRWTEVFIIQQCDDEPGRNGDPADVSRLSESVARATCIALVKFLDHLAQAGILRIAIRVTIHPDNVGYEAGNNLEKLPAMYMDSLDNELVPVLHEAASSVRDGPATILELVFHIMLQ